MKKNDAIDYLDNIKKYFNLSALCELYNTLHSDDPIDYNNLRVVISRKHTGRLSEDKLNSFIKFLHNDFYKGILKIQKSNETTNYSRLQNLVDNFSKDFKEMISNGMEY